MRPLSRAGGVMGARSVGELLGSFSSNSGKSETSREHRIGGEVSEFGRDGEKVGRVGGQWQGEGFLRQRLACERERERFAALSAERINGVDPRLAGDREAIDVVLKAAEIQVVDAEAELAVHRGAERDLRIGALRGGGLGDFPAARIDEDEPRQQR